jgi:hypothetical protein
MPLFPIKPREKKSAAAVVPAWHPNFRNFERLPDTKTVRTAFYINVGTVVLMLLLLAVTAGREFELSTLKAETAAAEEKIAEYQPKSEAQMALFKKFQAEEQKLLELRDFVATKFVLSDFLLRLGETLPPKIGFRQVEYRPGTATAPAVVGLIGEVHATAVEAAGLFDAYVNQLRTDPIFSTQFEDVDIPNQSANPDAGTYAFELRLKLKDAAKSAKPKEAAK